MNTLRYILHSVLPRQRFVTVILYSLAFLFTLGLVLAWFSEQHLTEQIEAEASEARRMIAVFTQGEEGDGVAATDRSAAITRILKSAVDGTGFASGRLISSHGEIVEVRNSHINPVYSPQWLKSLVQRRLTGIELTVDSHSRSYGAVLLTLSVDKMAGRLWNELQWGLTLSLIGLFAGAPLILARIRHVHGSTINPLPSKSSSGEKKFEAETSDDERQTKRDIWIELCSLLNDIKAPSDVEPDADDIAGVVSRIRNQIHEREESLHKLIRQNEALVQHAIVSVSDLNGDIVYANDMFCQISGYSRDELIGNNHRIVNSGFHPPELFADLWQTISGGNVWHGQIQNRKKCGEIYWVDVTIAPLMDADGLPNQYISIRTVITDSKNAELEMSRQRRALEDIIEGTNAGTWEWNTSTGAITLNQRWAQMIGYTMEELGPMNIEKWSSFFHPEDLSCMAVQQENHMNGTLPILAVESRVRHKDGHWVWVLDKGKLVTREVDGRPSLMAGTRVDISERKRAELDMQRSEQLLRSSIEAIDEAFVLYDADDRLVLCNEKYRSYYPASKDLVVPGARFEDIVRHGAESGRIQGANERVDEWVSERVKAHRAGDTTQVQRFDDGRILRVIDRHMPDGHTVGLRVDITELVHASEAAQAASLAKSQFLANISHELRTPMNSVLGMLTLLRKTQLNARQLDYVNKSQGAARSLLGLLNEILDFSKIEAGKMTLDPHPFSMEQLLRDLSVILSSSIGAKPVEVIFDVDTTLPRHMVGDAMRLQQILVNLCGNAIKFTDHGEVTLSLKVLGHEAGEVTLEISVSDTGIGIAPENLARIFSGFTQAEASTTRRFGGTGLGLSISHKLVNLMGGTLQVNSVLGQGSRFYFNITLAEDAGKESEEGIPSIPSSLRALIVDDNPSACRILESMARSLGWETQSSNSGEAALTCLQEQEQTGQGFQVVFMDYEMSGIDGWQTTQRIREMHLADKALVIATVTANGAEMLSQRSEAEHALLDGFVIKPVTPLMLLDAVTSARDGTFLTNASGSSVRGETKRLQSMRLLVVEDNPNNQQLARELLESEGAKVKIVSNGQEGVDLLALHSASFDVVLMDLQMPVMDGLTATRMIRRELGQTTLPIVAMTANAMDSDRRNCLSAGMNDHVGKPFDLDQLIKILRKQAGWKDVPKNSIPAKSKTPDESIHQAANAAGVDIAAALGRMGGNSDVYLETLRTIIKDFSSAPSQLRSHLENNEIEQAVRLLHTLKGLSATVGAMALSTAMAHAEKQIKNHGASTSEIPASITEAPCQALVNATPGLAALLRVMQAEKETAQPVTHGDPKKERTDLSSLHVDLRSMADQLQNADMAVVDMMNHLRQRFDFVLGEKLRPLDEAVNALDFTRASHLCTELMTEIQREGDHALENPATETGYSRIYKS